MILSPSLPSPHLLSPLLSHVNLVIQGQGHTQVFDWILCRSWCFVGWKPKSIMSWSEPCKGTGQACWQEEAGRQWKLEQADVTGKGVDTGTEQKVTLLRTIHLPALILGTSLCILAGSSLFSAVAHSQGCQVCGLCVCCGYTGH